MDADERRADPRAPIQLRVDYKRMNAFFADYTRNICRGGTFIRTDRPLAVGTDFLFQLHVPKLPEPLLLRGRVQRIVLPEEATADSPPGMAIGFIYETESERQTIHGVMEQLMVESLGRPLYEKLIGDRTREP